jgi:uncharacterized membrane protein YgcG
MPALQTEVANQEINRATLKNEAGHGKVLPPPLQPLATPTTRAFLTQLAASKAAGVAAILLSLVNDNGLLVEELDSYGKMIVGFVLYPVGKSSTQKITGIAVMQMGSSSRTPSPFTAAQLSAWGLITNELKLATSSSAAQAPAGGTGTIKPRDPGSAGNADNDGVFELDGNSKDNGPPNMSGPDWLGFGLWLLSCGEAAAQVGANPISDVGCIGGAVALSWKAIDDSQIPADPPVITLPSTEDPTGPGEGNSTSQDGDSTSGRDGGDDGSDGGTSGSDDGGTSGTDDGGTSGTGDGEGDDGGGGAGCFVAGTPVHTSDGGWKPIEDIALEAQLASCDEASGAVGIGAVTRLFSTTSAEIITVSFHNEKLCCTPRHRFFTNSGWLAARHLSPGIKVQSRDGEMRPILAISHEPAEVPVFNMRVDSQHTYFVGETGYLVHNEKDTGEDSGTDGDDIPGSIDDKERSPKMAQPVSPPSAKPKT